MENQMLHHILLVVFFFKPKLKAEYEAIKLFGPGEKAATEQNNT